MGFVSDEWPQAVEFFEQYEERIRELPGVTSVASAYQLPTDSGWNNAFAFDLTATHPRELPDGEQYSARFNPVTPGYFETAGIRLIRGRTFTAADSAEGSRVVIVNERFVERYFEPGTDPIGARLNYGNWWQGGPARVRDRGSGRGRSFLRARARDLPGDVLFRTPSSQSANSPC